MNILDFTNSPLKNISDIGGNLAYRGQSIINGSNTSGIQISKKLLFNSNSNGVVMFPFYSGMRGFDTGTTTISFDVFHFEDPTTNFPTYLRLGNGNFMIRLNNIHGTRLVDFYNTISGNYKLCRSTNSFISGDKKWHNLTFSCDNTETGLKIYKDGSLFISGSSDQGAAINETNPTLYIGNDISSGVQTCGFIKNIKIWAGTELSQFQIIQNMNDQNIEINPTFSVSLTGDWPISNEADSYASTFKYGTSVFLDYN